MKHCEKVYYSNLFCAHVAKPKTYQGISVLGGGGGLLGSGGRALGMGVLAAGDYTLFGVVGRNFNLSRRVCSERGQRFC